MEDRKSRVELNGGPKVAPGGVVVAQGLLDHPPVEEKQRVPGTEVKRLVGVAERLGVAVIGVQLPGQGVGHEDAVAASPLGLRRRQAFGQVEAVVGPGEGELEVGVDAVRLQQALLGPQQRPLAGGCFGLPADRVEVAELAHVLGDGIAVDDGLVPGDGAGEVVAGPGDAGQAGRRWGVGRVERNGPPEGRLGPVEVVAVPGQLAQVVVGEGGVGGRLGRLPGQLEQAGGAGQVTLELPGVGGAGIGTHRGSDGQHALDGVERLGVTAELDERIAADGEHRRVLRVDRRRLLGPAEALGEVMAGVGQGALARQGLVVALGPQAQRPVEAALRLGIELRVAGEAGLVDVGEAESAPRPPVPGRGRLDQGGRGGTAEPGPDPDPARESESEADEHDEGGTAVVDEHVSPPGGRRR